MKEIGDANALRGEEFGKMVRRPLPWILIIAGAVVFAFLGNAIGGAGIAAVGFLIGIAIGLVIALVIADHRAEDSFYESFAKSHGLTWQGSGDLERATRLLRSGNKRKADEIFTGQLAEDIEGTLALYTYTVVDRDSDGSTKTDYPFTLVLIDLPETVAHLPELLVEKKSGFKMLEGFEDKLRRDHERVTLESEALRDRYEIFVGKGQDTVWVRRLFSPSFIVWLTETPPDKFAFELSDGKLCAYVPKYRDSVEGLNEVIETGCAVARRLREEAGG